MRRNVFRKKSTLILDYYPVVSKLSEISKRTRFDSSIEDKPDNINYKDFKQWLRKTFPRLKNYNFKNFT